jgi:hypothetical protein
MSTKKTDLFKKNYVGPTGPHLSCITDTTRYGSYEDDRQISIHPTGRHKNLHRRRDGDPICAPKKG